MATRITAVGVALLVALGVALGWGAAQQTTTTAPPAVPPPATAPSATTPDPKAARENTRPDAATPGAVPPLDLTSLEKQLKDTKAIGVFTKISLKNKVDDLLKQFADYHRGQAKRTIKDLRRSYDLLLMKVLSLVQDEDRALALAIVSSREAIWELLADPKRFATLKT